MEIIVKDPKRIGEGRDSYISYSIIFKNSSVERRYSEFESFRSCVLRLHPTLILPPLPEKLPVTMMALAVNKNAETSEVIEKRKRQLQMFLNHLLIHPTLTKEPLLEQFLQAESWSQVLANESEANPSGGLFSNFSLYDRGVVKLDPQFAELHGKIHGFGQCAGAVERGGRRLTRRQCDLAGDHAELAGCFNHFSLSEKELGPGLEKMGMTFDQGFLAIRALTTRVEEVFLDPLEQHVFYVDSVKGVLQRREQLQAIAEEKMGVVSTKRNELKELEAEAAGIPPANPGFFKSLSTSFSKMIDSNPEQTRKDNIAKLQASITQSEEDAENANAAMVKASEVVQAEFQYYEQLRAREMKKLMVAYAQAQIEFYHKQVQAWGVVVPLLEVPKSQ